MARLLDHNLDSLSSSYPARLEVIACVGSLLGAMFLGLGEYVAGLAAVFGPGVWGAWLADAEYRRARRLVGPRRPIDVPREEQLVVQQSGLLVAAGRRPGALARMLLVASLLLPAILALSLAMTPGPVAAVAAVPFALLLLVRLREQAGQARVELRERGLVLSTLSVALRRCRIVARYGDLDTVEIIPFAGRWRLILMLADGRRFHLSVRGLEEVGCLRRILRERLRHEPQPGYEIQQVPRRHCS